MAVASTGPGDDAAIAGVGGHLAEQRVLCPAAHNVNRVDPAADQLLERVEHHPVAQRRLSRAARIVEPSSCGRFDSVALQKVRIASGMFFGATKLGSSGLISAACSGDFEAACSIRSS